MKTILCQVLICFRMAHVCIYLVHIACTHPRTLGHLRFMLLIPFTAAEDGTSPSPPRRNRRGSQHSYCQTSARTTRPHKYTRTMNSYGERSAGKDLISASSPFAHRPPSPDAVSSRFNEENGGFHKQL